MSGTVMVSTSVVRDALLRLRSTMVMRPSDVYGDWLGSPAYAELDGLLMAVSRGSGPDEMLLSDALGGLRGLRRLDATGCGDRECAYRSGLAGALYTAIGDAAGYISGSIADPTGDAS